MRPNTHTPVELLHPSGSVHAAEVAFLTDGYVALHRPEGYPEGEAPHGEIFELSWPGEDAVNIQRVVVTERPGRGDEIIWELVTEGEIRTEERRPRARVELRAPLVMSTRVDPHLETTEAMLTDLSESSLRVAVYGREWSALAPGTLLHVGFMAANTYFDIDGSVLRTYTSSDEDDDGVEIIVLLDIDEQTTGSLRLAVLAERQAS